MNYILAIQLQIQVLLLKVQALQAQLNQRIVDEAQKPPIYQIRPQLFTPQLVEVKLFKVYPISPTEIKIEGWISTTSTVSFKVGLSNSSMYQWGKQKVLSEPYISETVGGLYPGNKYVVEIAAIPLVGGLEGRSVTKEVVIPCTKDMASSGAFSCNF